jgi:hypothetical protein
VAPPPPPSTKANATNFCPHHSTLRSIGKRRNMSAHRMPWVCSCKQCNGCKCLSRTFRFLHSQRTNKLNSKNVTANPSQSLPSQIQPSVNPDSVHVVSRPLSVRNIALLAGGPHAAFIRHSNDTIVEFCQGVIVSRETCRPSSAQDQKHQRHLLSSKLLIEAMHRFRRFAHAYRPLRGPTVCCV